MNIFKTFKYVPKLLCKVRHSQYPAAQWAQQLCLQSISHSPQWANYVHSSHVHCWYLVPASIPPTWLAPQLVSHRVPSPFSNPQAEWSFKNTITLPTSCDLDPAYPSDLPICHPPVTHCVPTLFFSVWHTPSLSCLRDFMLFLSPRMLIISFFASLAPSCHPGPKGVFLGHQLKVPPSPQSCYPITVLCFSWIPFS